MTLPSESDLELAARAAWLYHLGNYPQHQIAERLGVSRIKVNRLISLAHARGLVRITVEHPLAEFIALEEIIQERFNLHSCYITPDVDPSEDATIEALGNMGAQVLERLLQDKSLISGVGLGWGRTLASVCNKLRSVSRPDLNVVALLGSPTRQSSTTPFNVVHSLAERTQGIGYFLPAPFFASTQATKEVLMEQASVQEVYEVAKRAELHVIGVGEVSARSFLWANDLLSLSTLKALAQAGAVGDMLGYFLDIQGKEVAGHLDDVTISPYSMGLPLPYLAGKKVLLVAGGKHKLAAIKAALHSKLITMLVTTPDVAHELTKA